LRHRGCFERDIQAPGKQLREITFEFGSGAMHGFRHGNHQLAGFPWRKLLAASAQQQAQTGQYCLRVSRHVSHANILHEIGVVW